MAREFCATARRFARKSGDATFEMRLALALARSFATSTRFILDKSLAGGMFLRGPSSETSPPIDPADLQLYDWLGREGERIGEDGDTAVLIDTSPDLRQQLLDAILLRGRLAGVGQPPLPVVAFQCQLQAVAAQSEKGGYAAGQRVSITERDGKT